MDRTDLINFINDTSGVQVWSNDSACVCAPSRIAALTASTAPWPTVELYSQFGRIPGSRALQAAGYNKLWTFTRREHRGDREAIAKLCR